MTIKLNETYCPKRKLYVICGWIDGMIKRDDPTTKEELQEVRDALESIADEMDYVDATPPPIPKPGVNARAMRVPDQGDMRLGETENLKKEGN